MVLWVYKPSYAPLKTSLNMRIHLRQGLSEEESTNQHGEENIEVYHTYYKPIEFALSGRSTDQCYLKVVTLREGEILGMHFLGLNAGEVIQGFVTALKWVNYL